MSWKNPPPDLRGARKPRKLRLDGDALMDIGKAAASRLYLDVADTVRRVGGQPADALAAMLLALHELGVTVTAFGMENGMALEDVKEGALLALERLSEEIRSARMPEPSDSIPPALVAEMRRKGIDPTQARISHVIAGGMVVCMPAAAQERLSGQGK